MRFKRPGRGRAVRRDVADLLDLPDTFAPPRTARSGANESFVNKRDWESAIATAETLVQHDPKNEDYRDG